MDQEVVITGYSVGSNQYRELSLYIESSYKNIACILALIPQLNLLLPLPALLSK